MVKTIQRLLQIILHLGTYFTFILEEILFSHN